MMGGLFGPGCDMMPMPILLALPSSPIAIIVRVFAFACWCWTRRRWHGGAESVAKPKSLSIKFERAVHTAEVKLVMPWKKALRVFVLYALFFNHVQYDEQCN